MKVLWKIMKISKSNETKALRQVSLRANLKKGYTI